MTWYVLVSAQSCLIYKRFCRFSAEQINLKLPSQLSTLLFCFALSMITNCKIDKILTIILIAIKPCDYEKNGIMMIQKCVRYYRNLKDCCIVKFLHNNVCICCISCTATFYICKRTGGRTVLSWCYLNLRERNSM